MNPSGHPEVIQTLRDYTPRILSDGLAWSDIQCLTHDMDTPTQWCARWVARSRTYEDLARQALAEGARLTAGELLWRAALCCHFGQGLRMDVDAAEKQQADRRKNALFLQAAPLLAPPMQRVEIPYEGRTLPGYLRFPQPVQGPSPGQDPSNESKAPVQEQPSGYGWPCMIVFGGLDTTKEDALEISNHFVRRGMAVLVFDGPGQGEALHHLHLSLRVDFEVAVCAAVDYACTHPKIDAQRVGVLGRSTGGHWACAAAARDVRIKVAIAWSLIWHLRHFASLPQALKQRFMRAAQAQTAQEVTEQEAMDFFAPFDLDGAAARIRCPVMVVQGGRDALAPPDSIAHLRAQAKAAKEIRVVTYPDSGHCAHDKTYLSKPLMADFAARHLAKPVAENTAFAFVS